MKVASDKDAYRPGDVGRVHVEMKDLLGNPVQGRVTLTGYDKAVTYIQNEFGPSPKAYFYGQRRIHNVSSMSNLDAEFTAIGQIQAPDQESNSWAYNWFSSYGGFVAEFWHANWSRSLSDERHALKIVQKV